jgi:hypothetical protein
MIDQPGARHAALQSGATSSSTHMLTLQHATPKHTPQPSEDSRARQCRLKAAVRQIHHPGGNTSTEQAATVLTKQHCPLQANPPKGLPQAHFN